MIGADPGADIVSAQTDALEGAQTGFVHCFLTHDLCRRWVNNGLPPCTKTASLFAVGPP
jgi:hypothetical protein